MIKPERFISIKDVCQRVGLSRTTVWDLSRTPGAFPQLVPIAKKRKMYLESEIDAWILGKVSERDRNVE